MIKVQESILKDRTWGNIQADTVISQKTEFPLKMTFLWGLFQFFSLISGYTCDKLGKFQMTYLYEETLGAWQENMWLVKIWSMQ